MQQELAQWVSGKPSSLPRILILDGGVSSNLGPESNFAYRSLWSSSLLLSPEGRQRILQGHLSWKAAHVLTTVTYQCHYERRFWPDIMTEELMNDMWKQGIELARQAAQDQLVVASSGCYGAALANGAEYTGDYGDATLDDLIQFHRRKLKRVLELQPDGLALETIPSLQECQAIAHLLPEISPMPRWVSLACRNGRELNDGTPVSEAIRVLKDAPAIGFNCCNSDYLGELVTFVPKNKAVVLYPNSGEEWDASHQTWDKHSGNVDNVPDKLLECIEKLPTTTRILVGGCCRTTPAVIQHLRTRVDEYLNEKA
jgi:homocysteine S-methyltransferase